MATDNKGDNIAVSTQESVSSESNTMDHLEGKAVKQLDVEAPDTGGSESNSLAESMELGSDNSLDGATAAEDEPNGECSKKNEELVDFKVFFNKKKHDICFPFDETIGSLKKHLETLTGVPPSMQKVMFKGLCKDDRTLRVTGIVKGAKVLVVGSTLSDVLSVNTPSEQSLAEDKPSATPKEPLCRQKLHKRIIDKGMPEDAQPGIKNVKDSLPPYPISGMVNKSGGKVRLTFKLELDQVWIGTKERTDKIPMNSIKHIVSEAIEGHEEYHIVGIQLGTTEASRYWLYWVPAQYIDAIKDAILGKWQLF